MRREPEPLEQIDYGANYKARGSAASHSESHAEGGNTAMCIIALIISVVMFTVVCMQSMQHDKDKEELRREFEQGIAAVEKRMMDRTASTEARLMDHSYLAKQEARVAQDDVQKLRTDFEIHKRGSQ